MGGVLPLAAAAYQRGLADLGARIGRLYAANTVGAVLGSLIAGFVLAPLAGPAWAAVWVAVLAVLTGVLVLFLEGGTRRRVCMRPPPWSRRSCCWCSAIPGARS